MSMVVTAENSSITAIPMNTIMLELTFLNLDITTITAHGINENTNALTIIPLSSDSPPKENPATTKSVAPSSAPEDIPVV